MSEEELFLKAASPSATMGLCPIPPIQSPSGTPNPPGKSVCWPTPNSPVSRLTGRQPSGGLKEPSLWRNAGGLAGTLGGLYPVSQIAAPNISRLGDCRI